MCPFMSGSRAWFEVNLLVPDFCFCLHFEAVPADPFSVLFGFLLDETDLEDVVQVQLQMQIIIQSGQARVIPKFKEQTPPLLE